MAILKGKSEGGSGGKRGHSNMDHWVTSEELKEASRKHRRLEAKEVIRHEVDEDKVSPGGYREVLGSDVINDGMYIELHDASEQVVACVFRSDSTGEFEVHIGYADAPEDVVSSFVQRAKDQLNARASD